MHSQSPTVVRSREISCCEPGRMEGAVALGAEHPLVSAPALSAGVCRGWDILLWELLGSAALGAALGWFQAAGALKGTAQLRGSRVSMTIPAWEPPGPGTMTSLFAAFLVQLFPHPMTLSQHHSACCCNIAKDTNHRAGNKKRDCFSPQQRKLLVKLSNEDPGKEWQRRRRKSMRRGSVCMPHHSCHPRPTGPTSTVQGSRNYIIVLK